jgi:DNA-binding MarR family transcriptional regulator
VVRASRGTSAAIDALIDFCILLRCEQMKQPLVSTDLPLGPALEFLQRLWGLNGALERLSLRMEKRFGVTAQQRLLIRCLGTRRSMTAGQLATLLKVDRGTVSTALGRLERKGLIERRRDPSDSRRVVLKLTRKGRLLDAPAMGTVEAAVEDLLSAVPAAQIRATRSVLEKLTTLVDRKLTPELEDDVAS